MWLIASRDGDVALGVVVAEDATAALDLVHRVRAVGDRS